MAQEAPAENPSWRKDLARVSAVTNRAIGEHPVLLVAFVGLHIFVTMQPKAGIFVSPVAQTIMLLLGCEVMRSLYAQSTTEDERKEFDLRKGGAPLLSLLFLFVAYMGASFGLGLLLVVPGIWWAIKSSLAFAIVSVEDAGALAALKRSHDLMAGRFLTACRYLLPPGLIFGALFYAMNWLLNAGQIYAYATIREEVILVLCSVAVALFRAVIEIVPALLLYGLSSTLYVYLKSPPPAIEQDI